MALPKLLHKPLKWLYCAAIVAIGFAGHAHLSHWHEDWSESLPPHQVERYVALVRRGDSATIEKLLSLADHEHSRIRNTAVYLLDQGGALNRLDRATRVDYLVRRLTSASAFGIYERDDPHSADADFDFLSRRDLLRKLWQEREVADAVVARHAALPGQFEQVLRDRWSTRWLYVTDRANCAEVLMNHLSVAVAAYRENAQTNQQSRRNIELLHAVPLISWLVAYAAHSPDGSADAGPQHILSQADPLTVWWQTHGSLTQEQREAQAIEALLRQGPPAGEKRRYAQWLLNRPLEGIDEQRWRQLREQTTGWTRLQWVADGFRRTGVALEAPWDAEDVELLLGILERAANDSESEAPPGFATCNALWLLERMAAEPPPPWSTAWIGPLVRFPWAAQDEWKIQFGRWSEWWQQADRAAALRDPAEPRW